MEKHELQAQLDDLKKNIYDACKKIDVESKKSEMLALEKEMNTADFWNDQSHAQEVVAELKIVKNLYETWAELKGDIDSLSEMFEELSHGEYEEFARELHTVQQRYDEASYILYFSGPHDKEAVLMTITSGVGGDDAEDFGGMILRMFTSYFDQKNFQYDMIEFAEGAGANGIKKATLEIRGEFVYGVLKGERGVHRLVRLSPFKSSDSRQTSFVHVEILPLFKNVSKSQIAVPEEEIRVDTFRASGAGGQKVNKTDSAVRITHIPTGIIVSCQAERSQHQNKERAMDILRSKLYQNFLKEQQKEKKELQGEVVLEDWGKQIRSYVLHPYKMVKDHRTSVEVSDVDKVLDGDLHDFIDAEIKNGIG